MDIKGPISRRLYVPQRLRALCDESCPYCGDSVIIIAIIFIIIIIISISILSLLQKNTSQEIVGLSLKKYCSNQAVIYIFYISSQSTVCKYFLTSKIISSTDMTSQFGSYHIRR